MSKLAQLALVSSLLVAAGPASALADAKKPAPASKTPAPAKKTPPAAPKKQVVVTADHKKALAAKLSGFKFGMSKEEVLAQIGKELDAKYDDQFKATNDDATKDRLRKSKKEDLTRVAQSYVAFDAKKTGWDVSIVEDEFAHNTNESMLERWENDNGKNQRRFFFFYDGKLWKMFISLDVSILPDDKKNFDEFRKQMEAAYGAGDVDVGVIAWHTDEFDARAIDKLKTYDAIGISIEDSTKIKEITALRAEKAPKAAETNAVIKAVVDTNGTDHPDVKQNGNAVDSVIQSNGGAPKKK